MPENIESLLKVHIDLTPKVECAWFSYSQINKYQPEEMQMVKTVLNFSLKDIKKNQYE